VPPFPQQLERMYVLVLAGRQLLGDYYDLYAQEVHREALEPPSPSWSLVEQLQVVEGEQSLTSKPSFFW
jgi:hypothetical protein